MKTVTINGIELNFEVNQYQANSTAAISLVDNNGEDWYTLTVCDPMTFLMPGEILVKTWSENNDLVQLLDTGMFSDTTKSIPAGFVEYKIWNVEDEELLTKVNDVLVS